MDGARFWIMLTAISCAVIGTFVVADGSTEVGLAMCGMALAVVFLVGNRHDSHSDSDSD